MDIAYMISKVLYLICLLVRVFSFPFFSFFFLLKNSLAIYKGICQVAIDART